MLITRTVTKKILETIVHETFSNFGSLSSSSLLDSLKFLGFYYATNAGISINIEDLKTPNVKKEFLKTATDEMSFVSQQWEQGFVSDTERFQTIIDSWNIATESLKNRIIDYYQNFDPANNLYIMAFSGARGNMSQVRQLVGMRGLMSDQEGKIIDLPIQTNFREGLSSIDYIISSYGARKGIVDTALKTADSGYLTRRLIYIAQDLIIREINCKTKNGIIVLLNKNTNCKNILGRHLLDAKEIKTNSQLHKFNNLLLDEKVLNQLKQKSPLSLNIRSPLTCESNGSICQSCYGWDLAQNNLISLGEAVGIIAAQSIGEPGTQLTMRTFHTGGIFTSELLQQTVAPFSGRIELPLSLKTVAYRTNHGIIVSKLQQEANIIITNWKGIREEIFLDIGSFLYIQKSGFIKKGELISEYSARSFIPGVRRLKPIYTSIAGEIHFESLLLRPISREEKPKVRVNQDDGILWLASGKVFPIPKEAKIVDSSILLKRRSFASLKIVTPYDGMIKIEENKLFLLNNDQKLTIDISSLQKILRNCTSKFSVITKNYQYVDKYTTIGMLYILPNYEGRIYGIRKKESKDITTYFLITENDVWKIHSDQVNNFSILSDNKVRSGNIFNETSSFSKSGFLLKKDGFKMIFQNAVPIFLSRGTILNYKQGDFVLEKQLLATLVNYTQQTEDIVQGLPKIEELIEARIPKMKSYLSLRPGIFLNSSFLEVFKFSKIRGEVIDYYYDRLNLLDKNFTSKEKLAYLKEYNKRKKQIVKIIHSISNKNDLVIYNDKIWKVYPLPPDFAPHYRTTGKPDYSFFNSRGQMLLININNKKISAGWNQKEDLQSDIFLSKYNSNNKISKWKKVPKENFIFGNNKSQDLILQINDKEYLFLESINPIIEYKLPSSSKVSVKPGNFVDIGEPITDGIIDPHELLGILFQYHYLLDGILKGTFRSLNKFQLLLVNSVQSIYQSQGVNISSKHIEIIVRQMTSKVVIKESGDTPFLPGEIIRLSLITEIYKALYSNKSLKIYKTPKFEPLFLSTTNSSLSKDGFLSAAGFQETKRVLTRAAIEGASDWLRGLKECVIIGRLIPAGSAFLNYKNYLDNIYLFKD
jgi:hypothetical protein|uniref:DNA-directed RNA polymerase n=1 Tax=Ochromonas sp. CCMP1393 TaxID=420556 RepID=A0A0D3ML31_9STRA|nr:DNA-directed RNA polymerase subunit beta'' [Ochromonas sp. CCMP1393]